MNKKVLTLCAGFLLAGLVTPTDALAAVKYADGVSFADATWQTVATGANEISDAILIVQGKNGGDYVIISNGTNGLKAIPFGDALLSEATATFTISDNGKRVSFEIGGKKVGFDTTGAVDWGESTFSTNNCSFTEGTNDGNSGFALATGANCVKMDYDENGVPTFSVEAGTAEWLSSVRLVQVNQIEVDYSHTNYPIADAELQEFDFGKYYILMNADGQYLKADEAVDGKVTATPTMDFDEKDATYYWTIEKQGATTKAAFKNKEEGAYLVSGSEIVYAGLTVDGKGLVSTNGLIAVADEDGGNSMSVSLATTSYVRVSVDDLQSIYGASFSATITRNKKELSNNPFTGNLTPVQWKNISKGYEVEPATYGDDFMLQNGDGKIIVMQIKDPYASSGNGDYAYKILPLDPQVVATDAKNNTGLYATKFSIWALPLFEAGTDETIAFIQVSDGSYNEYRLGSISLDSEKNQTLAAEKANDGEDYLDAIDIKLSKNNLINLKEVLKSPSFFTVKNVNTKKKYAADNGKNFEKVLGLNEYGNAAAFMDADEVLVGYPETQWAITTDGETLTLKNRENTTATAYEINANELYIVPGKANTYAWVKSNGSLTQVDTLEIAPVSTTPADGYKRYDARALRDMAFNIGHYSDIHGVAYVSENHTLNHQIGLEKEAENATSWRLGAMLFEANDAWNKPYAYEADTIRIESALGYWDANAGAWTNTADDDDDSNNAYLKLLAYSLKNIDTDEYVKYDTTDGRDRYATGLEDDRDGFEELTDAQYFALKMTGDDRYNLIPVSFTDTDGDGYANGVLNTETNELEAYEDKTSVGSEKVYTGDSATKGVLNKRGMYTARENDLFTVEELDSPAYLKLEQGDTIKIYREEFASESNVLYEKAGFLGVGNAVENADINPALYVDTAYVNREGNNRWEYLLAVNVNRVDTTYRCNVPAHGIHRMDTTYGRFLVNFADSAIVTAGKDDIHVNKYLYTDNYGDWAKLGFVEGYRTADTLRIWNGEKEAVDAIEVGTPKPQLVKFAFRIVDDSKNAFVIETAYKNLNVADYDDAKVTRNGYLRFDNGVVYVTDDIENAEVFMANLDEDRTPTANESIEANSAVSVTAIDGAVVIKGAEGKNVVIATILGKVVANETINSDNETIAVPAGIAVVSVDGESFKVVVK